MLDAAGSGAAEIIGVAVAVALVCLALGAFLGRRFMPRVSDAELKRRLDVAERDRRHAARKLESTDRVLKALRDERDLWDLRESEPPNGFSAWARAPRPPVLLVANLKGGVGKTTLAANLAGFFDITGRQRVLLLDLDYQGSLSSMAARAARLDDAEPTTHHLISGDEGGDFIAAEAQALTSVLPRTRIMMAQYVLAQVENRSMIEWALGETETDGRFNLARALMHPHIAETYDLVIIDAPPRLSFAMINALAASSHILAPTTVDGLSAETVGNFFAAVGALKGALNPHIRLAGVVATMAPQIKLGGPQLDAMPRLREAVAYWGDGGRIFDSHIPRRQAIAAAAGSDIAYATLGAEGDSVRALFDPLGEEVAAALGWTKS